MRSSATTGGAWEKVWDVVQKDWRLKFASLAVIAALFTAAPIRAQEQQEQNPAQQNLVPDPAVADGVPAAVNKNGFHVYQVSGSVGYSTLSSLLGSGSDFRQLGCDCYGVASTTTGYTHTGPINRFDAVYTPSYSNYYGLTGAQGFNENLQLVFESRFAPKWKFSLVATADDSSVVAFALQPGINTLAGGQDLGSFVGTTMSTVSPGPTLLYGGRVFSAGGHTGVTYRPTTRFRISLEGGFFQSQTRSGSSGTANTAGYVIPRAQFENVDVIAAYSLTPRTEVGGQASVLQYHTVFGDYRATSGGGTFSRKLSRRWSAYADAGVATYIPVSTPAGLPRIPISGSQFTTSLGLGYHGRETSFIVSYQKMAGDLYGLASSSSQGVRSILSWRQPGRNWSADLAIFYQRLTGGPVGDGDNWQASASLTRALTRKMALSLSYGYLSSSLAPVTVYNNLSAQVLRLTFTWIPVPTEIPGNAGPLGGAVKTTP